MINYDFLKHMLFFYSYNNYFFITLTFDSLCLMIMTCSYKKLGYNKSTFNLYI